MIRFAALNYSSSEEDSQDAQERAATKEAEESEAFMLYNRALSLQRQGNNDRAEEAFRELLQHPFITEALEQLEDVTEGSNHPALQLLYSIHKNIANMALQRKDYKAAIMSYIEAVKIDTTEVTVWYKIGTIAKQIYNFPLARMGFEVGLQCNPNHWPCLDNVITLLYAMNDYWYCLYYISRALMKDHGYTKGLVLRQQIFKEDPLLKDTTTNMFKECDPVIDKVQISQEEKEEFINESLYLADERRKLIKPKQSDQTQLPVPLQGYSWCALGEALLLLYKMLKSADPPKSMANRVDLSAYNGEKKDSQDATADQQMDTESENMDVDVEAAAEQLDEKTVTSLEQILSALPADQMTELLQSTPPTPVKMTSSINSLVTSTVSPMETGETEPVEGEAKCDESKEGDDKPMPDGETENLLMEGVQITSDNKDNDQTDVLLQNEKEPMESVNGNKDNSSKDQADVSLQNKNEPTETVDTNKENIDKDQSGDLLQNKNEPETGKEKSTEKESLDSTKKEALSVDPVVRELFSPESLKSKGTKRKKGFMEEYGGKRRSARVRNTSKRKEEDCINFQELLLTFLPSNLRDFDEDASVASFQHVEHLSPHKQTEVETIKAESLVSTEEEDVKSLLLAMQKNGGCIELMMQFIFKLAEKSQYKWPVGLNGIFIKIYKSVRDHFDLPDTCSDDEIDENLIELGQTLLLNAELQLDQWAMSRSKFTSSPLTSKNQGPSQLKESDLPAHYHDDEYFIIGMMSRRDVLGDDWHQYCCRVYWMKARFYMLQGKMEDAVFCFKKTLECLKTGTTDGDKQEIFLPTCSLHNVLSVESVESQLKSLERSQSFDVTQKLYDSGEYEKVVECLLKTTLTQVSMATNATERRSQLQLLLDSLIKLKDYKKAFLWSEVTLDEAVQAYKSNSADKEQWAETMVSTCQSMNLVLKSDYSALSELPNVNQARLSHNLIYIIDTTMSVPDSCVDLPINTVLPWILLFRLIERDEKKSPKPDGMETSEDSIPPSVMLLNIAHEYLGRHSWCTRSDGELLLFTISILSSAEQPPDVYNEEMGQAVEQCFYCLYGHPAKKGRYRHLVDHNAPQIELTWERTEEIFNYFKPKSLPEFDSYKTEAVPGEVEHLLRRICNLVPESQKPIYVIDSLQDYIEGTTETFDEESIYNPSEVSKELYYLLADYYFKNHELAKAVKYYLNDICVNPSRFDSWAGMALAKMSQLEQKLNSNELKMDFPVHKKSIAALRCFRRALQIDVYNGKLWMEYGSLAYQLHSHSSRQLRYKLSFPLNPESEQIAKDTRQEMLQTSHNCYRKAIECENEEAWLQHYMIGKCHEKMNKAPEEYLRHYQEAARYLYEENAPYPKKIAYAYTTPHLAVEALEMFYRLHTSILKLLLNDLDPSIDYQTLEKFILQASVSPFALGKQKNEDNFENTGVVETPKQSQSTQQDHTYSRQKQKSLLTTDSLENSLQSFSDSQSQESNFMSSRQVSQSEDVSLASADSCSQPMDIDDTEGSMASKSQGDITLQSSESQLSFSQSQSKTFELSANDMREEVTNVEQPANDVLEGSEVKQPTSDMQVVESHVKQPANDLQEQGSQVKQLDLRKPTHIELIKKRDKDCGSPSSLGSSDLFEDEDGNITVTAKLEVIGRSSSSDNDSTSQVTVAGRENDGRSELNLRSSLGFEPMITDEQEQSQIAATEQKEPHNNENSQEMKNSVSQTLSSVLDVVETAGEIVSNVEKEQTTPQSAMATNENKDYDINNTERVKNRGDNSSDESMAAGDIEAIQNTSLKSICQYDSTSSEDDEMIDNKSQEAVIKTPSGGLTLCAENDSVKSEGDGKGQESIMKEIGDKAVSSEKSMEPVNTETISGKQGVGRSCEISLDDLTPISNVNVLEISEGGISGDTCENDNKVRPQDSVPNDNIEEKVGLQDPVLHPRTEDQAECMDIDKPISDTKDKNEKSNDPNLKKESRLGSSKTEEKTLEKESMSSNQNQNNSISLADTSEKRDGGIKTEIASESQTRTGESNTDTGMKDVVMETKSPDLNVTTTNNEINNTEKTQTLEESSAERANAEKDASKPDKSLMGENPETSKNSDTVNPEESNVVTPSGKSGEDLRKLLIEKCMAALHLCLSRFPTHYKSIFRLAHIYMYSPFHKNLKFCQDLLLGLPNWQHHSHMPAQGLFGDRKQNNFFQGVWRIPIGDIDRSGSFASHMNKSVLLLMDVLKERKELTLMYQIHLSLNRSPESGKKYLRDSERILFVKMSYRLCWEIIDDRNKELPKRSDTEKLEKILMEVYKIWNYGNSSKMKNDIGMDTNQIFGETFQAVMKEKVVQDRPLFKQAVDYCQHYNQMKHQMQKANQDQQGSGNKNDSSFFSPTRSPFGTFSPSTNQSGTPSSTNLQKWTASPQLSQQSKWTASPQTSQSKWTASPQASQLSSTLPSTERLKSSPAVSMATSSSLLNKSSSALVSTSVQGNSVKNLQPHVVVKNIQNPKLVSPVVQHKDSKSLQRKPAVDPFTEKQVLVDKINPESIFETLLASEFGESRNNEDNTVKTPDETDGSSKNVVSMTTKPSVQKQTIVLSKSSTDPIICKVKDALKGGLSIMSPEFGNLEVISPNTPCPDSMKFTIPSKDPNAKTKTTIVITKKKAPIKIIEPIEISSSDDEDQPKPKVSTSVQESSEVAKKPQAASSSFQESFLSSIASQQSQQKAPSLPQKTKKLTNSAPKGVINLEELMDSAEDSIPSSSASGSVYVPDDSSSDSIPSSPEPQNCRLDEVTGLLIPPDVKFFNDKNTDN